MYFPHEIGSGKDGKETPAEYADRRARVDAAIEQHKIDAAKEKYMNDLRQCKDYHNKQSKK